MPDDKHNNVGPLPAGVGVEHSVEVLLAEGLGVDHVGHPLHSLQSLERLQQHLPGTLFYY